MGEGRLACFSVSHIAKGAELGSCLSLVGATVMAKPMVLYMNRGTVAEEGEAGRLRDFRPKIHSLLVKWIIYT